MTTLDKSKLKRIIAEAGYTFVNEGDYMFDAFHAVWIAAQAEQREIDVQLCLSTPIKTSRQDMREACANAIRSQK